MLIGFLAFKDFAGSLHNLYNAVRDYTGHETVYAFMRKHQFDYPLNEEKYYMPTLSPEMKEELKDILYNCDVLIMKENYLLPRYFGLNLKKLRNKKIVLWFTGGNLRRQTARSQKFLSEVKYTYNFKKLYWTVGTPDLLKYSPKKDTFFIPICHPIDEYRKRYNFTKETPPLIVQLSTQKLARKAIWRCFELLKRDGFKFRGDVFTNASHDECLRRKAPASIFFDRFRWDMYANNCIESAGFESVVLNHHSEFVIKYVEKRAGVKFPFLTVSGTDELWKALKWLLKDSEQMKEIGKKSYEFVKILHDGIYSTNKLMEIIT